MGRLADATCLKTGRVSVLVVEDNRADVFLIREALERSGAGASLQVIPDGEAAIHFFDQIDNDPSAPCPALVMVDLNLPKRQGRDVLACIRQSRRCAHVPVLIVTSSDAERERDEMARLGVQGYFRKPSAYEDFMKLGEIVTVLLGRSPKPT